MSSSTSSPALPIRLIGVLGGSFDPPHLGHAALARYALAALDREARSHDMEARVWILPAGRHPFGKAQTPAEMRLEMCRLAFDSLDKRIETRDDETVWSRDNPDTPTYTIDTLKRLAAAHPDAHFRLILGGDLADEVEKWRAWDRITVLAPPLWIPRAGYAPDQTTKEAARGDFEPLPEIASSDARRMLAAGESVDGVLAPTVAQMIATHRLYQK